MRMMPAFCLMSLIMNSYAIIRDTPYNTNGLYICDTYCYSDMPNDDIWIDSDYIDNTCYNNKLHTISNLSCYGLLIDKNNYRSKQPWIENLCTSNIITCELDCSNNDFLCIM